MNLAGKRILITGVVNRESLAYAVAARAQEQGADILLTNYGKARRVAQRTAAGMPNPPDVLELDVTEPSHYDGVREYVADRWGGLDGIVHSIAFAPPEALGGNFLSAPNDSAVRSFEVSALSLKSMVQGLDPVINDGASIVGFDFDASVAWPIYDWMGVSKAALESVARYLARDLGPRRIRVNLVSAGVLSTVAARGIPYYRLLAFAWSQAAPLGWDAFDAAPVGDAACFLLSDWARAITGEILHVDGGVHAIGLPLLNAQLQAEEEPAAAADRAPAPAA
ncbi:MAG TPA: enoyl-ACP reductase FabI [Solirubrobacteraceae bacterium]|jgi:enoyl-[acyl-carrier protein] reductase I|nr:enoyl-ACP reductase FabI [Solirubrobacteraceae bacterium]